MYADVQSVTLRPAGSLSRPAAPCRASDPRDGRDAALPATYEDTVAAIEALSAEARQIMARIGQLRRHARALKDRGE